MESEPHIATKEIQIEIKNLDASGGEKPQEPDFIKYQESAKSSQLSSGRRPRSVRQKLKQINSKETPPPSKIVPDQTSPFIASPIFLPRQSHDSVQQIMTKNGNRDGGF